jgi:hypothetical protein
MPQEPLARQRRSRGPGAARLKRRVNWVCTPSAREAALPTESRPRWADSATASAQRSSARQSSASVALSVCSISSRSRL